jgi:large subunit ribosomal protein L29
VKASEMREKTTEELTENLRESRRRLFFQMKMQRATGEGVKPHEMSQLRRDIARLETVLRERRVAAAAEAEGAKA